MAKLEKSTKDVKVETSMYAEIVDRYKLPKMSRIPKEEGHANVRFTAPVRLVDLRSHIVAKTDDFKTWSECDRAAYYLGIQLIYHMTMTRDNYMAHEIYKKIQAMEQINHSLQLLDNYVRDFEVHKRYMDSGMIGREEGMEMIADQIEAAPKKWQKELTSRAERLFGGESFSSIASMRAPGRPGSKSQKTSDSAMVRGIISRKVGNS